MNQLLMPQTYSELVKWADMAAKTDMVPKNLRGKAGDIILAVQYGQMLGMNALEAVRGIAVINGIPSLFGDSMLAMCKRHPEFEDCIETPMLNGVEVMGYVCEARRKGHPPVIQKFDIEDAKRAKLWGKEGPWTQYPQRMLQMRARSWALRDQFADMLRGVVAREEAEDTPTIDGNSVISAKQLNELVSLLTETNTDSTAFLKLFFSDVDRLDNIPPADFNRCITALRQKLAQMPKPQKSDEVEL